MTYTGDVDQLGELEPLDESVAAAPSAAMAMSMGGGLPAPAYNPTADKEYYRFLFAGVLIVLGCLMPFGPQPVAGYMTLRGGLSLVIGLGIVWSSWASISNRRMIKGMLRWVMLAGLLLIVGVFDVVFAFDSGTAVAAWNDAVGTGNGIASWGEFFANLNTMLQPGDRIGGFFRHFGSGRLMVLLGAFLAEFFMIAAIFGGARKIKEQKAERRASAANRKR